MRKLLNLFFLALITGCSSPELSLYTEYISIQSLPSYIIGTPDPRLYCPDYGEKLHISWFLPHEFYCNEIYLYLHLLYGNGAYDEKWIRVDSLDGVYALPLLNEEYREKDGIFTYKVALIGDGCILLERRHILWAEPILLEDVPLLDQ
jgi:hypothetical protein